ncbi:BatA domain-containing protein [Alteromonas facilis]|uniref:BatA domain-containing protein n=1 Tax=Alteromonas facilis TaxID=2048004 RepID=UPI000C281EDE|nr:BatA domain-containing protein [Alteromonas facilis]
MPAIEWGNINALWGLLGLLVPIIIHLISRSRVITRQFAFIRLLPIQPLPVKRNINLSQRLLLLVRMVLVILAVLLLANVSCSDQQKPNDVVYVVTPDWLNSATVSQHNELKRSIENLGTPSQIWLLSTHPVRVSLDELLSKPEDFGKLVTEKPAINIWGRVNQLFSLLSVEHANASDMTLHVFTTNAAHQFQAELISVPMNTQWHVAPSNSQTITDDRAQQSSIAVGGVGADAMEWQLFQRAFFAINQSSEAEINVRLIDAISSQQLEDVDRLIVMPDTLLTTASQQALNAWLYEDFSHKVTNAAQFDIQDSNFPVHLITELYADNATELLTSASVLTEGQIALANAEQLKTHSSATKLQPDEQPVPLGLAIAFISLLLLERLLSEYRREGRND